MSGNYDKMLAAARDYFVSCGLAKTAHAPRFFGEPLQIDRESGEIFRADGSAADVSLGMTVYDYLSHLPNNPVLCGRFTAHENLNTIRGGTLTGRLQVSREAAGAPFAGKIPLLREACLRLGGQEQKDGDFAAILPLLDDFPVYLRFYDADDEFPARLQILWDENTPQFLTYETSWYTTGVILQALNAKTR